MQEDMMKSFLDKYPDLWFTCMYCTRAFKLPDDLINHKREMHRTEFRADRKARRKEEKRLAQGKISLDSSLGREPNKKILEMREFLDKIEVMKSDTKCFKSEEKSETPVTDKTATETAVSNAPKLAEDADVPEMGFELEVSTENISESSATSAAVTEKNLTSAAANALPNGEAVDENIVPGASLTVPVLPSCVEEISVVAATAVHSEDSTSKQDPQSPQQPSPSKSAKRKSYKKCTVCSKVCKNAGAYVRHMSVHRKDEQEDHGCRICPQHFKTKVECRLHESSAHVCPWCHVVFPDPTGHKDTCRKKPTTDNSAELTPNPAKKGLVCKARKKRKSLYALWHRCPVPKCRKAYMTSAALCRHKLKEHSNNRTTSATVADPKQVSTVLNIEVDSPAPRNGSSLRKFKCNYCDHSFKKRAYLEYHENVHKGVKPYDCLYCERKFRGKFKRTQHLKDSHPKEYAFSSKYHAEAKAAKINMLLALNAETDDSIQEDINEDDEDVPTTAKRRRLVLRFKGRGTSIKRLSSNAARSVTKVTKALSMRRILKKSSNLNTSTSTTEESPPEGSSKTGAKKKSPNSSSRECPICSKSFSKKTSLKSHMYVHKCAGRFPCKHCSESFCFQSQLRSHHNSKHPGEEISGTTLAPSTTEQEAVQRDSTGRFVSIVHPTTRHSHQTSKDPTAAGVKSKSSSPVKVQLSNGVDRTLNAGRFPAGTSISAVLEDQSQIHETSPEDEKNIISLVVETGIPHYVCHKCVISFWYDDEVKIHMQNVHPHLPCVIPRS